MAQSILTSGSEELKKARDMLAELQGLRTSLEGVRDEKAKADRTLQTEERAVTDTINSTVKKRRADLESGFDKEIQKEQTVLKKVKSAREKAKSKGIEGRVTEETSELRERNRMLHRAIRSMFKQKGLPKFCDSKLYYALYMPSRLSDFFTCVFFFALFFVLLPGAGTFFVDKLWQKVLVIAVIWLVVGGIYALLYTITKGKDRAVLVDMKDSRKEILKNEKEIRRIRKAIHADKSEEHYGLEGFDEQIQEHEANIVELTDRKHAVMMDFETNTRKAITEEITQRNADRLEAMRVQCAGLNERCSALSKREKELTSCLASEYQAFLGLEYMNLTRLQALIDLIDSGKAATVREAMNLWEKQERDRRSGQTDAPEVESKDIPEEKPEAEADGGEVPDFEEEAEKEPVGETVTDEIPEPDTDMTEDTETDSGEIPDLDEESVEDAATDETAPERVPDMDEDPEVGEIGKTAGSEPDEISI